LVASTVARLFALAGTALAIAAVGFIFWWYFNDAGAAARLGGGPAVLAGTPARSYTIADLAGKSDSLQRYRGRVVLLNLWASWCAPCRSETPSLERLYEADRGRGLVVLGVDEGESRRTAAAFATEMSLRYPILVDSDQLYGRAYASIGLPTSIVVDRNGRIVAGVDGEMTLAQMHDAVDPVLRRAQ
jgi:thiol-disulfide isomerase/thioredoxin